MFLQQKASLLVLLTACALLASGCSASPPQGGSPQPGPIAQAPQTTESAPLDVTESPSPEVTEASKTPSSQNSSTTAPEIKATPTEEAVSKDGGEVPGFSTDSCLQQAIQNCLEPLEEAPLGAAPPQSQVTGTVYPYTVTSYVEWVIGDLHTKWNQWFVSNNFTATQVYYRIIRETDAPEHMSCTGGPTSVPHDYPNAFYCGIDPYPKAGRVTDNGMIFLPVTTMQRMWTGEVLGKQSKRAGDFAAAIIVAHEYGHSVQDELAIQWEKYYPGQVPQFTGANKEAIADCFAGVWMTSAYYEGVLEPGDVDEAVAALNAVGAPQPGSTHPSSAEREAALTLGYLGASGAGGDPMQCVDRYWK
jgi:hypothetical protein